MNIAFDKTLRFWLIILGFFTAIFFYWYILNPYLFKPNCLTDTEGCYKIIYKTIDNTALVNVVPSNNWYVYTNGKIYVYTQNSDYNCKGNDEGGVSKGDNTFSPALVIDTNKGDTTGDTTGNATGDITNIYSCIENIDKMTQIFKDVDEDYIFYRPPGDKKSIDVYDVFNLLFKKEIIY